MARLPILTFIGIFSAGIMASPDDKAVADFFRDKTKIENPFELRDPFKAPNIKSGKKIESGNVNAREQAQTNEERLAEVQVSDIKVVGVLIGKERRAAIRIGDKSTEANSSGKTIFVKEGTKIGPDQAEVKAILPGGIVLVEKITNVYGQEEYLETVIPISK